MAEAAARRDARRRKILQNSENRMNRLLGKPAISDCSPAGDEVQDQSVNHMAGDVSRNITNSNREHRTVAVTDNVQEVSEGESFEPVNSEAAVRHRLPRGTSSEIHSAQNELVTECISAKVSDAAEANNTQTILGDGLAEQSPAPVDPVRLLDLIRCGGCFLIAFFTRWALQFGLGILFLELVVIPFLLLEGFLFYFQTTHMKDIKLPHKSSLMTYALIFSGIKQDVINKYNVIMGYISAITEDFALFLFAFLICHAVIS